MILTIKDAKKFQIKPAIYDGKIFGVRVYDGYRKIFPGTIPITQLLPEVFEYIKESYKWDLPYKANFHRD